MCKEEFVNYHEVDLLGFQKYIESIGFKYFDCYYDYKEYRIFLNSDNYSFYNGSDWDMKNIDDLTPFNKYFKQELRSIKLKQLLG